MRGFIVALAAAGVALFLSFEARALDAPHDVANPATSEAMLCSHCHTLHGSTYPTLLGQLCQSCHVTGGPAEGPGGQYVVQTHSSRFIDNSYGNWEVDCWSCHDPHTQWMERDFGATRGVFLRRYLNAQIKEVDPNCITPYCSPLGTLRTESGTNIQFDAATRTDFVDNDAESLDDICRTCHVNTTNHNKVGTPFHTDYGTDTQPLGNCTACHSHANGFAVAGGGGCTGCHSSLQPGGAPPTGEYRRQVVGAGGDFERRGHHVTDGTTTEIVADSDCQVCHAQDNHQSNTDPQVRLYNADDHATIYTYDGTGGSVAPFCLSCHDSDGSAVDGAQPFSDGRTPPDIATGWNATGAPHAGLPNGCISCHGGADSTDAAAPDYEHNVHGACSDFMLSGRIAGGVTTPTVSFVRVDKAAAGRNEVFELQVNGTLVANYVAARNDTPDVVRDALLADINGGIAHGQPVTGRAAGPVGFALIPTDACTSFTVGLGASDDPLAIAVLEGVSTASYVCMECHDADGPSTHNIAAQFDVAPGGSLYGFFFSEASAPLSRTHDIGLAVNCSDCHNPHGTNGLGFGPTDPRRTLHADPDPDDLRVVDSVHPGGTGGGTLWSTGATPSTWLTEWCLACHDGVMPTSVRPPSALTNIWDVWRNVDQHGFVDTTSEATNLLAGTPYPDGSGAPNHILNCEACHIAGHDASSGMYQTRTNPLDAAYAPIATGGGGTVQQFTDPDVDGNPWCGACHAGPMNGTPCQGCHNHADSRF